MTDITKACADIIRGLKGNEEFSFDKVAEEVIIAKKNLLDIPGVDFKKIAQEIRKAVSPVEITYTDLNNFIKEIR